MLFWLRLASLHTLRHPKKVEKTIATEKSVFSDRSAGEVRAEIFPSLDIPFLPFFAATLPLFTWFKELSAIGRVRRANRVIPVLFFFVFLGSRVVTRLRVRGFKTEKLGKSFSGLLRGEGVEGGLADFCVGVRHNRTREKFPIRMQSYQKNLRSGRENL